jgi:hypothetical protein
MIHRQLEAQFAARIEAARTGTALAGIPIRYAVPTDPLALPCVIVSAAGSELVEGGVRSASRVSMDFSVLTSANDGADWQTSHKNRVAALSRILDDTNTNTALAAINSAQTDLTLYGWHLVELSRSEEHTSELQSHRSQ